VDGKVMSPLFAAGAVVIVVEPVGIGSCYLDGAFDIAWPVPLPSCTIDVRPRADAWAVSGNARRCLGHVEGDNCAGSTLRTHIWAGVYDPTWDVLGRSESQDVGPKVSDP
jgi:hypothetical protein